MHVDRPAANRLDLALAGEDETEALGRVLALVLRPGDVVGLVGTLGAGKTRLSRAIAVALGVDPGAVASPTFVLIHEYAGSNLAIYHFDAYRLASPDEFDALGAADYWAEGDGICLVEWADLVADRLPDLAWWVRIELDVAVVPMRRSVAVTHPDAARVDQLGALLGPIVVGSERSAPGPS